MASHENWWNRMEVAVARKNRKKRSCLVTPWNSFLSTKMASIVADRPLRNKASCKKIVALMVGKYKFGIPHLEDDEEHRMISVDLPAQSSCQ